MRAIQLISTEQAMALDRAAPAFLPATQPVQIKLEGSPVVGYRIAIPTHCNY